MRWKNKAIEIKSSPNIKVKTTNSTSDAYYEFGGGDQKIESSLKGLRQTNPPAILIVNQVGDLITIRSIYTFLKGIKRRYPQRRQ